MTCWNAEASQSSLSIRAFTRSALTITLFTSERVKICSAVWRSTMSASRRGVNANTAYWMKQNGTVTAFLLMCCMMRSSGQPIWLRKRSEKRKENTFGRIGLFWIRKFQKPTTGAAMRSMRLQAQLPCLKFCSSKRRKFRWNEFYIDWRKFLKEKIIMSYSKLEIFDMMSRN